MAWNIDKDTYYYSAFINGSFNYSQAWGFTQFNTSFHMENMSYYHAIRSFYEDQQSDIIDRRCLLYHYLSNEFNINNSINADGSTVGTQSMLNKDQEVLPVQSEIKRITENTNILYDEAPTRVFSQNEKPNKILEDLYNDADIDSFNATIDGLTWLCGVVAVAPVWRDKSLSLTYLTADSFRVLVDINSPTKVLEMWVQDYDVNNSEPIIRVWTDNEYKIVSGADGSVISTEPNRYGKIPYVFCRTVSNDFYSPGQFQFIEDQLVLNKIRYLQGKDMTYHGLSLKIMHNVPSEALTQFAYDQFIFLKDEKNFEGTEAGIEFLKPDPAYLELQEFADKIRFTMYRKAGIPASMITDENAGQSGISRIIERTELIELRKKNIGSRKKYERELCEMIVLTGNKDNQISINPAQIDFSIDYAEITVLQEPKDEYEFDTQLMNKGLLNPVDYVKKWGGLDTVKTKVETADYVKMNLELKDEIFGNNETILEEENPVLEEDLNEDLEEKNIQDMQRDIVNAEV